MEASYFDQNKRDYEIAKHVSLMLSDPMALIALKVTGRCELVLPEGLFDADYPGHFMRRLKSASLTIPCIVGPYTSVNCTLTLLSNKTRMKNAVGDKYEEKIDEEDDRFVSNFASLQSIATSHAQNDSGMFELNFRDERYLPFEGAGAISRWRVEMPKHTNAFDFNTLTDVVLHLRYTAREGGEILRNAARKAQQDALANSDNAPLARFFSLKHEFPTEWYRFLRPSDATTAIQTFSLDLLQERFPFQFRGRTITISQASLFLKLSDTFQANGIPLRFVLSVRDSGNNITPLPPDPAQFDSSSSPIGELPFCVFKNISIPVPSSLVLTAQTSDLKLLDIKAVEDIWAVFEYSLT
jgi:hypothetical protein